jgi:ferredoxin-nitrite reductase
VPSLSAALVPPLPAPERKVEVGVFAGELAGSELAALAEIAAKLAGGVLLVTGNQNIAFHVAPDVDLGTVRQELVYAGFPGTATRERVACRVCPGNHECLVGLGPTREIAATLLEKLGPAGRKLTWAISGCPNSCAQPQLADAGIIISRLAAGEDGGKAPLFDLYRREGAGLGEKKQERLTLDELLTATAAIG